MPEVKHTLKKLNNSYLLTSNEEIREGDYYYESTSEEPFTIAPFNLAPGNYRSKVIARLHIPLSYISVIDFSELSKADCKRIGFIDVKKLARKVYPYKPTLSCENHTEGFKQGFFAAQNLMGFSKENLTNFLSFVNDNYYQTDVWIDRDSGVGVPQHVILDNYLDSLNKVTEWSVEIEHSIINDNVKVTKIL
jgi:hypothetical protein